MPGEQIIRFEADAPASRLDQLLTALLPDMSRSQLQKLIRRGKVRLSGQIARPSSSVRAGDLITVALPAPSPELLQPEAVPLDIIFEDDDLIVVNKAAGMVVHPAPGHPRGTLVNALLARYPELTAMRQVESGSAERPGIVHRLDQDTSGLIVVARTPAALRHLRQQFKARTVEKIYLALVVDRPQAPEGVIDVPLGRDPRHRQKFAPRPDGKAARTHFRMLEDFGRYSLLEIAPETGRTHQIRVHLAWLKCPVVGDAVYGRPKNPLGLDRQFLHAWRLRFKHPGRGNTLQLEAPLADDLQEILHQLRG